MFTILLELEVDRSAGTQIHGQWVQPEKSAVCAGTWVHGTSLVNVAISKQYGHFTVANCWLRWLACRVYPDRYNPYPLHAYSSRPIECVSDFLNRLRDDEIRHMEPCQINLITNAGFRERNSNARAGRDYAIPSWSDPANEPLEHGWRKATEDKKC